MNVMNKLVYNLYIRIAFLIAVSVEAMSRDTSPMRASANRYASNAVVEAVFFDIESPKSATEMQDKLDAFFASSRYYGDARPDYPAPTNIPE